MFPPESVALNKAAISPIWTWVFVKPNSNISWYAACALLEFWPNFNKPETSIPSWKAFFNKPGLDKPSNKIPFAAVNAPALKKFLKWVGIEKIVLAICETPLGNNNKFL